MSVAEGGGGRVLLKPIKFHDEAAKDRDQTAGLRDESRQLESQVQLSAGPRAL